MKIYLTNRKHENQHKKMSQTRMQRDAVYKIDRMKLLPQCIAKTVLELKTYEDIKDGT